jgi:hypothetical protein
VQAIMENFQLDQCLDAPLGVMMDASHQSERGGSASFEAFGAAADPSEAGGSSLFDVLPPPWELDTGRSQTLFLRPTAAMTAEFPCAVAPAMTSGQSVEVTLALQSAACSADAGSADALALHLVKPTHPFFDVRTTLEFARS